MGEPQSRSGRFRDERNPLTLPGIELLFLGLQPVAYVAKITFLFGFVYHFLDCHSPNRYRPLPLHRLP